MTPRVLIQPDIPALVLAPMEGLTDAPVRELMGELGAFTFGVSEFLRVNDTPPPPHVFHRHVPELCRSGLTRSGLPIQVQLLGGDPGPMAEAGLAAVQAGAEAIDINFGCPAKTVNRHDGGATLLKHPQRLRAIVAAVRAALPQHVPVSAKLRLGWDDDAAIFENAAMAAEGGAAWLTIHGRTRADGYRPPARWRPIGEVRERLGLPVVANGDLFTLDALRRCRDETGCVHFMLGRGALADPDLPRRAAIWLGLAEHAPPPTVVARPASDWLPALRRLAALTPRLNGRADHVLAGRIKQWLKLATLHGGFPIAVFDGVKRCETATELFAALESPSRLVRSPP